jgi:hypothetical protein
MSNPQRIEPIVGDWYSSHGQLFEVVATDDDHAVIEIQHADGSLEEMELEDWLIRARAGSLTTAEPPEDTSLATDHDDEQDICVVQSSMNEVRGLRASALEDLDLFD